MSPATRPRDHRRDARLLRVGVGVERVGVIADLALELTADDVLVLNDAATLPALLSGQTARGEFIEARLAAHMDAENHVFRAVLFGEGDTSMRTEDRPAPPHVAIDTRLTFFRKDRRAEPLVARVVSVDARHERLVTLAIEGDKTRAVDAIFRVGRPIQYAYVERPLALWNVTPAFASLPWSFEPASAGLTLDFRFLARVKDRGTAIATITHAAGISSTGDPSLDARLPFAERSRVTEAAAALIRERKRRGGRVFAVGTTVTRALESAATRDERVLRARYGMTDLVLGDHHQLGVVDAIVTGVHVRGESHHELLTAFQGRGALEHACTVAEENGFLTHEFGDAMLVYRAAA